MMRLERALRKRSGGAFLARSGREPRRAEPPLEGLTVSESFINGGIEID
jgi:hypothetical protein